MAIDEAALKGGGFIKQRQAEYFVARVKVLVGDISAEQLRVVADLADRFGRGDLHMTVRQGIEIPWVRIEDFEAIQAALAEVGLSPGACGPRVRVPVCCPGSAICKRGLNDTKRLARELDAHLYGGDPLPQKFKAGVTGCSASCAKPQENDIGFMGAVEPVFDELEGECIACGLCMESCPVGAITADAEGRPVIDPAKCERDGKCVSACPTRAIRAGAVGWRAFIGGKFGSRPTLGVELAPFVTDEEAVAIAQRAVDAYRRLGRTGERLRNTIDRVGFDAFREEVL